MAVPLSPDEVLRKRMAIFKHESQKDKALFPGTRPARVLAAGRRPQPRHRGGYDKLGLAEYEAIEGFVRWKPTEEIQPPTGHRCTPIGFRGVSESAFIGAHRCCAELSFPCIRGEK